MHGWATTTSLPLSGPEQDFLDASVAERDRELRRTGSAERRAVAAERRERQRVRQLVGVGLVAVLVAALAVFGAVQWRSAADAKGDVDHLLTVADLVAASEAALVDDPELSLLLAVQAVRETVDLGFATEEADRRGALLAPRARRAVRRGRRHSRCRQIGTPRPRRRACPAPARVGRSWPSPRSSDELTDAECDSFFVRVVPGDRRAFRTTCRLRGGVELVRQQRSRPAGAGGHDASPWRRAPCAATTGSPSELEAFTERTGIEVDLAPSENQDVLSIATGDLDRPDIVAFQSGIPTWAQDRAMDIGQFVDSETLRADFGEYLLGIGPMAVGGEPQIGRRRRPVRAIPLTIDLKGLVFYPKAEFEAAGYEVPATWDELIALSRQIVADGGTPWCFGFASGFASGWPGSDLIESLVLRVGGIDTYDAWTAGDVGFASPAVIEAGRLADALVFEPGFVRGGPAVISSESYDESAVPPAEPQPGDRRGRARRAGCTTRPTSCSGMFHRAPGSVRTSTSSCFRRSIPVSRPRAPAAACSRRRWSTGPRFGRSWSSSPVRSGVRSGRPTRTAASSRRIDDSTSPTYGDAAADPAAAVRTGHGDNGPDCAGRRHVAIRRLGSDAHRDRRLDRRRRAGRVLARACSTGSTGSAPSIRSSPTSTRQWAAL